MSTSALPAFTHSLLILTLAGCPADAVPWSVYSPFSDEVQDRLVTLEGTIDPDADGIEIPS